MKTLAGILNAELSSPGAPGYGIRNRRAMRGRTGNPRRGFTLIELMVVIVVIAILMGLALPVYFGAKVRVIEAKVGVEIKQLESALMAFKAKYGADPPSRISIYLTYSGWTGDPTSMALIRQIWPQFDFYMGDPGNNTTNTTGKGKAFPTYWSALNGGSQVINLNSGECLFFFLGGVMQDTASGPKQMPTGFAKNPQYPFAPVSASSNREGPFFEFSDVGRIRDLDGNGMNEWYDPIPEQVYPYLYFSSYGGQGYRVTGTTSELPSGGTLLDVYRVSALAPDGNASEPAPGTGTQGLTAQKAQSCQIISPGYDGLVGVGGVYNPQLVNSGLIKGYTGTAAPNFVPIFDTDAYDNITNFSGGRLKP